MSGSRWRRCWQHGRYPAGGGCRACRRAKREGGKKSNTIVAQVSEKVYMATSVPVPRSSD